MKLAFAAIILIAAAAAASLGVSAKPNAHHSEQPAVAAPKEHVEHVAPTVPVVPVVASPAVAPVAAEPSVIVHHSPVVPVVSQYSPAAVVPVVPESAAAVAQVKPVVAAHAGEQYGQPESAAIPANYKPFGSWGLYIGGNPADGYYTNYYKSLSSSVEKQAGLPVSSLSSSAVVDKPHIRAGLNPLLRQASVSSSPYQGADYYPFSYSAVDFAANPAFAAPHALSYSSIDSPLVVPSQYIPEPYSTKRAGQQSREAPVKGQQQQVAEQQQQQVKSQAKGQQQLPHFYAAPISGAAVVAPQPQQQQQPQVVAYPVPVGSQIVGSQVGVDGAFFPYGVHAFTKYAIKPVVEAQAVPAQQASAAAAFPSVYHSGAYSPAHFAVAQPGYKFAPVSTGSSSIHHQPSFYASGASNLASGLSGYYAYPAVHDSFE